MVRGIGVDIIEITRIAESIETAGDRFLEKVFTAGEIAYCAGKAHRNQHYAARFAAKEAVSKALHTGWTGAFRWKDVEVVNDTVGRPEIVLHGTLRTLLTSAIIHISISHADSHVVAMAVIEDRLP